MNNPFSISFFDAIISSSCSLVNWITPVSVLESRIVFNALRNETSFISEIRCINNVFNSIAVMVTIVYYKDKEIKEIIHRVETTLIKANGPAIK